MITTAPSLSRPDFPNRMAFCLQTNSNSEKSRVLIIKGISLEGFYNEESSKTFRFVWDDFSLVPPYFGIKKTTVNGQIFEEKKDENEEILYFVISLSK